MPNTTAIFVIVRIIIFFQYPISYLTPQNSYWAINLYPILLVIKKTVVSNNKPSVIAAKKSIRFGTPKLINIGLNK